MAILAECDICGAQQRVKDALGGNLVRCKECGVQIKVLVENVITSDAFVEENGVLRRREPDREIGFWSWLIAVVVSCLVMLSLTGVVWGLLIVARSCYR